jgi:hypothetical protein
VSQKMDKLTRKRNKALGLGELIAIALGGMVGGGIFQSWELQRRTLEMQLLLQF